MRHFKTKKFLLAMAVIINLGLIITLLLYADETPQQFEGFDLTGYTETGEKSWDIKGATADIKGNIVDLTQIYAHSYGKDPMTLKAKKGQMDKAKGKMHLEKDIVITTQSGAKLLTDSLDWDRKQDLVTTQAPVYLSKQNMEAEGKGAKAHPNLSTAQINKDVTVTMETSSKEGGLRKITITCDGPLEIDYQKQYAVFHKNVVARDRDRELHADKMEVFFDTQNSKITKMICTGNVVIVQGKNKTYSEKAEYSAADQKLILSGRPRLIFFTQKGLKTGF